MILPGSSSSRTHRPFTVTMLAACALAALLGVHAAAPGDRSRESSSTPTSFSTWRPNSTGPADALRRGVRAALRHISEPLDTTHDHCRGNLKPLAPHCAAHAGLRLAVAEAA
jgi:hypothetical protein